MRKLTIALSLIWAPPLLGNVVGSDFQNFNPTTNGIDYVTVHSSETLDPGIINLGLMFNYAVNTLPVFDEEEGRTQNRFRPNDSLTLADISVGMGIWRNLELGLNITRLLRQSIETDEPAHGEFTNPGYINWRAGFKYRLRPGPHWGVALMWTSTFNRVENNPYLGTKQNPIHHIAVAIDNTWGPYHTALNVGYRRRDPGDPLPDSNISPTRDQLIGSVASSYLLPVVDTKLIGEVYGSRSTNPQRSKNSKRQASSLEALLGVKFDYDTNIALHAGGATELIHGVSSPDWRAYAGINVTFGPVFEREPLETKVERTPKIVRLTVYSIEFEFDSAGLSGSSKAALDKLAAQLREGGDFKEMTVEGHTDSVGREEYNQQLSEERAASVRAALVKDYGFDPKKIKSVGFGESRPIADNGNFQGRKKNRRVEVQIKH